MALSTDLISADLAAYKQQIINETIYQLSIKAGLKNYIDMKPIAGKGNSYSRFPIMGGVTATETPEGAKAAVVKPAVTYVDISATKKSVFMELPIEAYTETMLGGGIVSYLTPLASDAIDNKFEEDIIALFTSFTTNTVGTTNTDLTSSVLRDAVTKLKKKTAAGANASRFIGVLSAQALNNVQSNIATGSYLGVPENLKNEIFNKSPGMNAFNLFDVPWLVSSRIVDNGSGDHICALFDRKAIGGSLLWDLNLDTAYDIDRSVFKFHWTLNYGVGVVKENWGVAITADGDA